MLIRPHPSGPVIGLPVYQLSGLEVIAAHMQAASTACWPRTGGASR
jgi:hypothetical protein